MENSARFVKKDLGACMPFFGSFFPISLEEEHDDKVRFRWISSDELNGASSFVDEISPDQSSDLVTAPSVGMSIFIKKHSLFDGK